MATNKAAKRAAGKLGTKTRANKKSKAREQKKPTVHTKRIRLDNGLLKNGSEARLLALAQRKTGVTVVQASTRLAMSAPTVRVTIGNLRKKNFTITIKHGKYFAK